MCTANDVRIIMLTFSRAKPQHCSAVATMKPLFIIYHFNMLFRGKVDMLAKFAEVVYNERFPETIIPHGGALKLYKESFFHAAHQKLPL